MQPRRFGGHDGVPQDIKDGDQVHDHSGGAFGQAPHDEGGGDSGNKEAYHDVVSANGHEERHGVGGVVNTNDVPGTVLW